MVLWRKMRNLRKNQGRTKWCSGAGARWLLVRAQHSPSCMPMRGARYDAAGRVASSPGRRRPVRVRGLSFCVRDLSSRGTVCATVRVPSPSPRAPRVSVRCRAIPYHTTVDSNM